MCRALAIGAASCGPDHPNVANRLNNLALLLQTTNRLAEAEPLMRRAIAIFETSLGPDHPDTLTARNNLAGKSPSRSTMSHAIATDPAAPAELHPSPIHPAHQRGENHSPSENANSFTRSKAGMTRDPHPASFAGHPRVFARDDASPGGALIRRFAPPSPEGEG